MKHILIFLILFSCKQTTDYRGSWISSGDGFENTLVLEKIEGKENTYKFLFDGWRKSYDTFAKQETKFLGGMDDEVFIIEIKNQKAKYSDDGREFDEEFPLYNEKEERCKLFFEFKDNSVQVTTEACSLIYGGFGVDFDGVYLK